MGSILFPNTFNGRVRSGGYFTHNSYKGENANAPDLKGRAYIIGVGWVWVAAWKLKGKSGTWSLSFSDMTDDEATKYCSRADQGHRPAPPVHEKDEENHGDIPF